MLLLNLLFLSVQLGVNIFLALVVGAIFFGVKEDQSGMQNRWETCWNSAQYTKQSTMTNTTVLKHHQLNCQLARTMRWPRLLKVKERNIRETFPKWITRYHNSSPLTKNFFLLQLGGFLSGFKSLFTISFMNIFLSYYIYWLVINKYISYY